MLDLPYRFEEYDQLLVGNEIILMRARDVGVVTPEMAINASLQRTDAAQRRHRLGSPEGGPVLRSTTGTDFDIPVGYNGDSYDRMMIRIEEMKQSLRIIRQAVHQLPARPAQDRCAAGDPPAGGRGVLARRVAEGRARLLRRERRRRRRPTAGTCARLR